MVTEINNIVLLQQFQLMCKYCLTELLKENKDDLSVDECFTPKLHDAIKKYNFHDHDNQLLLAIKKIQAKNITNCDADEFYSVFYSDIVIICSIYLLQLCTLVATRSTDKVLHFSHREPNLTKDLPQTQSVRESSMDYNI